MNPSERAALKRVLVAAQAYVAIVSSPPAAPAHKAMDAERQAFDALEEAVNAAIDRPSSARSEAKPELGTFAEPTVTDDDGAWS